MNVVVKTFGDLLKGHSRGQIRCLYSSKVVRLLGLDYHNNIILKVIKGPWLVVSPDTPIKYEPWVMDRGSLIFHHNDMPGVPLKLCGEGDIIKYENDTEASIVPSSDAEEHPHEVRMIVHGI